jgi:release factor glutamine methyltransferase
MPSISFEKAALINVINSRTAINTAALPTRLDHRAIDPRDEALLTLGFQLKRSGYSFTSITPASHHRVIVRKPTSSPNREDVFGWSRSFRVGDIPAHQVQLLGAAGELAKSGSMLRSRVRFSTLANQIFVHSAYPTEEPDAVFFGPDTYRFTRLIRQALPQARAPLRLLDIGAGSGAGGLHAASLRPNVFSSIVLSDINRRALRFSRINALLNGIENVEVIERNLFAHLAGTFDVIIANPPYLVDPLKRLYRHGGGPLGSKLSLDIVRQAVDHLAPAGRLILYSGSAIVNGVDRLHKSLSQFLNKRDVRFEYEEIDPDVFGEELDHWPYDRADRIAVIGLIVDRVQ